MFAEDGPRRCGSTAYWPHRLPTVSISAGGPAATGRADTVPTGWEVVVDLARRVAALEGDDAGDDPAVWYQQRLGE
jgi:hypothetical protein